MTKSEIRLLNKISSETTLEASERQLAKMLNLSERAVRSAIDTLLHTDLIFRQKKGDCATRKSVFRVNSKMLRALEEKHKRTKEEVGYEVVFVPKDVKDANERAEREAYYAQRKREIERREERIEELLRDNSAYQRAQDDRKQALYAHDWEKMGKIDNYLKRVRDQVAAKVPEITRCHECGDTGTLPDGAFCTCWKKAKQRR